ncbi:Atu4866 domain-containing protein [Amycolatopsis sp. lyj-90]
MWVTADGHSRPELRTDGCYDEARGAAHRPGQARR